MENCLFCRIVSGEIPSSKVFENDLVYAFRDINPQAPFHVLVVPKKHVASVAEIDQLDNDEIAACLHAVKQIASEAGELSPSVESCGCGLGPSPVRTGLYTCFNSLSPV